MFRMTSLLKRKPGTTMSEFTDYHENRHLPLLRENLPQLKGLERNYLSKIDIEDYGIDDEQPFDCVVYSYFDDEQAFSRMSPTAIERIAESEESFLDRSKSRRFKTDRIESPSFLLPGETVPPAKKGMWKLLFTLKRKPGLTLEQMKAHYEYSHVPMAHKYAPELRYYVRNYLTPADDVPSDEEQLCDCVTESWYENIDVFQRMGARLSGNGAREEFSADEALFLDRANIRWFDVIDERQD